MGARLPSNLGLDLARVTEAAALGAGRWMGFGKRDEADQAATHAMAAALNELELSCHVVIGEESRLGVHSPLDSGEEIGGGLGPGIDLVLDPIDGSSLLTKGYPNAISVAGAAPRGAMLSLYPAVYMEKIVVDRQVAEFLVPECMDAPAAWTLALVARMKKKAVRDLVVFVLDRKRHVDLIEEIRVAGARVLLHPEGDIAGALMAAYPKVNVDLLMGVGGVPEGIIAACAVKPLSGAMLARLAPQSEEERELVRSAGLDLTRIYTQDDLVSGEEIFFAATGITDGVLLSGVKYHGEEAETESLVLRCQTGTRRIVQAVYRDQESGIRDQGRST